MFPTYDMNPIAISHMQQERLNACIRYIDRAAEHRFASVGKARNFRAGGVALALIAAVVVLV